MIQPTIGRVVHYFPANHPEGEQPLAAIVAHVNSDRSVNLAIFGSNGAPAGGVHGAIPLVQPEDKPPTDGHYCAWMPYQIESARSGSTIPSAN